MTWTETASTWTAATANRFDPDREQVDHDRTDLDGPVFYLVDGDLVDLGPVDLDHDAADADVVDE